MSTAIDIAGRKNITTKIAVSVSCGGLFCAACPSSPSPSNSATMLVHLYCFHILTFHLVGLPDKPLRRRGPLLPPPEASVSLVLSSNPIVGFSIHSAHPSSPSPSKPAAMLATFREVTLNFGSCPPSPADFDLDPLRAEQKTKS